MKQEGESSNKNIPTDEDLSHKYHAPSPRTPQQSDTGERGPDQDIRGPQNTSEGSQKQALAKAKMARQWLI